MNRLLEEFKKVREDFIEIINKFPVNKREEVLFDKWNLRQVLAHMQRWDNCLSDNVDYLKQGKEPPFYGKVNDFNAVSQDLCKDWDWNKTYEEFLKGGERLIKTYKSLPENLWNQRFWKDKNSTPLKFLKIVTNHYKEEHLPLLKGALK